MTKTEVEARLTRLQRRRAEVALERAQQLNRLDAQIARVQALIDAWDTMTIDEALTALDQAGLRVRVEQA